MGWVVLGVLILPGMNGELSSSRHKSSIGQNRVKGRRQALELVTGLGNQAEGVTIRFQIKLPRLGWLENNSDGQAGCGWERVSPSEPPLSVQPPRCLAN